MKHILLLFALISLFHISSSAQSIYGNVADFHESNSLDFANVEIFKDEELVASLITDKNGNYNVALLDTGTYIVNVMYSGYKTHTEEIVVKGDKNMDYKLLDNPDAKKRNRAFIKDLENRAPMLLDLNESKMVLYDSSDSYVAESTEYNLLSKSMAPEKFNKIDGGEIYDGGIVDLSEPENYREMAYSMGLTAGEINDFGKWELWNDLSKGELAYYQKTWKTSLRGRYCVQLVNGEKLPLVDARVELRDSSDKLIWTSRTDNTGKAELWETITYSLDSIQPEEYHIKIVYHDIEKEIKKPTRFEDGINMVNLKADCEASYAVDIAFVVDATSSMQDEIDYLKLDINDVLYQSKQINDKLKMRFGSVFYRDHGDAYLTKKQDFTKVLSASSAFIEEQFATGGGDAPEAVEDALSIAIDSLSWSEESRARILFLVLDAPPHNNSSIQKKLRGLMKRASAKGIRIVPITGSGLDKSTEYLMRTMSLSTNGSYTFLTDHSGVGDGHIDPSTDEYELELLNELLVRLIQSYLYVPSCDEEVPEIDFLPETPDSLVVYEFPVDFLEIDTLDAAINSGFIDELKPIEEISWKYYPNPTYGPITIEVSKEVEMLYLTDMSGKILKEITMNGGTRIQTDLTGLPMGIYFLRYPIGKKWLSGKVVLMR